MGKKIIPGQSITFLDIFYLVAALAALADCIDKIINL
jgi:hypothetical protein